MALALSNVLTSGCALQLKQVMTRHGHEAGRVFDVQCRRSADGATIEIVALVYGKRGLLERLGVRAHCDTVAWEEVAEVTEEASTEEATPADATASAAEDVTEETEAEE